MEPSGEAFRRGMAHGTMGLMDVVDDDLACMVTTFYDHTILMVKELSERGISRPHALAMIVSFAAGASADFLSDA